MKLVIFLILTVCLIKTALTLEYKEYEYDGEYDDGKEERRIDEEGETVKVNSNSAYEKHDTNDYYYDEGVVHKQSEDHEISSQPKDSQKSNDYDYDESRSIKQSSNSHNIISHLDTQSKPVANKDSAKASQDYQYYDESSKLRSETQNNGPAAALSSLSSQNRGSVLSTLVGGSVSASVTNSASKLARPVYDIKDAPNLFKKFKQDFNKDYKDAADEKKHFDNFVKNLEDINKTNSNPTSSYSQDINQFADWGKEEQDAVEGFGDDY